MAPSTQEVVPSYCVRFFESPVSVELLLTVNENSVLDSNRARVEANINLSPIHIILSEANVSSLCQALSSEPITPKSPQSTYDGKKVSLPRVEVLSRFLVCIVEVSIVKFRLSLVSGRASTSPLSMLAKEEVMTDSLTDFLLLVSSFDLSYPNEDSLSAAMQICIDRLVGLGLSVDQAWEVTNTTILNFLESVTEIRRMQPGAGTNSQQKSKLDDIGLSDLQEPIQSSVERIVAACRFPDSAEVASVNEDFVLDIPAGISFSLVKLCYDFHTSANIPSLFVKNGSGVHIVRLTPPEGAAEDVADEFSGLSENAEFEGGVHEDFSREEASEPGITFVSFVTDRGFDFGKGGLPLSVLGTNRVDEKSEELSSREMLHNVDTGSMELLFCQSIIDDCLGVSATILAPMFRLGSIADGDQADNSKIVAAPSSEMTTFTTWGSLSVLFLSDDLFPFSRVKLSEVDFRNNLSVEGENSVVICSKSLTLLNLLPAGEIHPRVFSVLQPATTTPFRVAFDRSGLQIDLRGLQVIVLQQFISECSQFFISEDYGLGLLLKKLGEKGLRSSSDRSSDESPRLQFRICLTESSFILPKSSLSTEMIAVEIELLEVVSSNPMRSFTVPSATNGLDISGGQDSSSEFQDCIDPPNRYSSDSLGSQDETTVGRGSISRTTVTLHHFRLFSSHSGERLGFERRN